MRIISEKVRHCRLCGKTIVEEDRDLQTEIGSFCNYRCFLKYRAGDLPVWVHSGLIPPKKRKKMMTSLISKIIDYESGDLKESEVVELFQELIDSGLVWDLQGSYGRTAKAMIDRGLVTERKTK